MEDYQLSGDLARFAPTEAPVDASTYRLRDLTAFAPDEDPAPAANLVSQSGRWTVEDGDTIIDRGTGEVFRLSGMDTPETVHADKGWNRAELGAAEATRKTLDFVNQREAAGGLVLERGGKDAYGRTLARIPGHAAEMIRGGYADPEVRGADPEIDQARLDRMQYVRENGRQLPGFEDVTPEQYAEARDAARRELAQRNAGKTFNTGGTLKRALQRGIDTSAELGGAFLEAGGQITGWEGLEETGREIADRNAKRGALNPAEVPSWDEVHDLGDFGTYLLERAGEQGVNIATMAVGGGVGGALAKRGATALVEQYGKKKAAEILAARAVAGRTAGAFVPNYPQGVGEVQQELHEGGIEAPGTALLAGIPIAGLDAIGFEVMLGRFFGGTDKLLAKNLVDALGKAVPKAIGVGMITEAPTEYAQELMVIAARAYHDPSYQIFSPENVKRLRDAAIAGGAVGGMFGGAGGVVQAFGPEKPFSLDGGTNTGAPAPNALPGPAAGPAAPSTGATATVQVDPARGVLQQQDLALGEPKQWYDKLPEKGMKLDVEVTNPDGTKGTSTVEARARAVELRDTMDAYRLLRQCLSR